MNGFVAPTPWRALRSALALACACLLMTAAPSRGLPRRIGIFELGMSHDSLVAVALRGGYRMRRNLPTEVTFAPPIDGDADVNALLRSDAVVRVQFSWPGTPSQQDFDDVIGEYIGQLGAPSDTTESGGIPQVVWRDDSTLVTVRASIGKRDVPLQGNLYNRATFESGGSRYGASAASDSTPPAKPRHPRKSRSRTPHQGANQP